MFRSCFVCLNIFKQTSKFSTSSNVLKNHYDALGITPYATQTDIKSAYYKLSKLYHPDKNKGSGDASKKFQDISAAYEVLGNFKLRKLYDKGILHTAGPEFEQPETVVEQEHPEEKFHRSRQTRHAKPTMSGKTPIYDFDEWSRSHYGATFERLNRAKERHAQRMAKIERDTIDVKNEIVVMSLFVLLFSFLMASYLIDRATGYDQVEYKIKNSK